jgi:hypothetical protein
MHRRLYPGLLLAIFLLFASVLAACSSSSTATATTGSSTTSQRSSISAGLASPVPTNSKSTATITIKGFRSGKKYTLNGGQAQIQQQELNLGSSNTNGNTPMGFLLQLKQYTGKGTYTIQAYGAATPKDQGDVFVSLNQQTWELSAQKTQPYPNCKVDVTDDTAAGKDQAGNPMNEVKGTITCSSLPALDPNTSNAAIDGQFDYFVSIPPVSQEPSATPTKTTP